MGGRYAYALRHDLFREGPVVLSSRHPGARILSLCLVFSVTIPVAFWSPQLASWLWVLALPARWMVNRWGRAAAASPSSIMRNDSV